MAGKRADNDFCICWYVVIPPPHGEGPTLADQGPKKLLRIEPTTADNPGVPPGILKRNEPAWGLYGRLTVASEFASRFKDMNGVGHIKISVSASYRLFFLNGLGR